eukprot:scaffold20074_cov20-Tisochrysis_lutea.AAC.3
MAFLIHAYHNLSLTNGATQANFLTHEGHAHISHINKLGLGDYLMRVDDFHLAWGGLITKFKWHNMLNVKHCCASTNCKYPVPPLPASPLQDS